MTKNPLRSSAGFTYIAAIVMVVIMGILLSQAAQYWTTRMQREREVELIFRGTQVRDALRRWYGLKISGTAAPSATGSNTASGATSNTTNGFTTIGSNPKGRGSLPELKALLSDPGQAGRAKFLRPSMLIDPMTGKEWAVVKDAAQRIVGVASTSEQRPIKQGNFPLDLKPEDFEGKKKYSEWQFLATSYPTAGATGGGVGGLKTTGAGGDSSGTTPSGGTDRQVRPEAVPTEGVNRQ